MSGALCELECPQVSAQNIEGFPPLPSNSQFRRLAQNVVLRFTHLPAHKTQGFAVRQPAYPCTLDHFQSLVSPTAPWRTRSRRSGNTPHPFTPSPLPSPQGEGRGGGELR
jgi:hypothetical protein